MIILLGSTGMMGKRISQELMKNNRNVWQPSRQWLMDFQYEGNNGALHQELQQKLSKNTILINTIGIAPGLGENPHKETYSTQKAIIDFCLAHNIGKIISLSALSRYPNPSEIPYINYRYQLDQQLLESPAICYIVRPSLIYAKDGASTKFFNRLTTSPILAFPRNPSYTVSPIDADELTQFILSLINCNLPSQVFEVGTKTITLQNYLKEFNPKLILLPLPEWIMGCSMRLLGVFNPAIAGKYAYELLKAGSTNQRDDFTKIMGYSATFPQIGENHHD